MTIATITSGSAYYSFDAGVSYVSSSPPIILSGVDLSNDGVKAIGGSDTADGLFYSNNGGKNWLQSNITYDDFGVVDLSNDGTTAVAAGNSLGVLYSTDSGQNWISSNLNSGSYADITISEDGTKAIVASNMSSGTNQGIWYSSNSGQTWIQSNLNSGMFVSVQINNNGSKAIAINNDFINKIYYSNNSGQNWLLSTSSNSNFNSSSFLNIAVSDDGSKAIAGSDSGIWYSSDYGTTWLPSNIASGTWSQITMSADGTHALASRQTVYTGIWYSLDSGVTWSQSNITTNNEYRFSMTDDGQYAIAGSTQNNDLSLVGLFYSINYGQTWIQSNITTGIFLNVLVTPPDPPVSNICFPAGTPITTDQGIIAIEKINPNIHTINKKPIVDIIRTIYNDKYLIGFKKNAISINCPSQFTVMTKNHKIIWQGRKLEAESFLYKNENINENVVKVKYSGQILYNVLMEEHSEMIVNNMICETLDPNNTIAKLYKRTSKYTANERYKISKFIADSVKNTKFNKHKTYKNIIKKL